MGCYIAGNYNTENPRWSRMWQHFDRFQNVLVLIYLLSCNEGIEIFLGCDLKVVYNSDFLSKLAQHRLLTYICVRKLQFYMEVYLHVLSFLIDF